MAGTNTNAIAKQLGRYFSARAPSARAGLRGGFVTTLVTDERTADDLLEKR